MCREERWLVGVWSSSGRGVSRPQLRRDCSHLLLFSVYAALSKEALGQRVRETDAWTLGCSGGRKSNGKSKCGVRDLRVLHCRGQHGM